MLSSEDVVRALSRAYQTRDPNLFASLLANSPDANAAYLFLLSAPTDIGETQWGYTEEVRIHQRMFRPDSPPPGDPPVPSELWLQSISITLTQQETFTERDDLYGSGGLDSLRWCARDARYTTHVFFDLQGTDYKVEGEANFIVLEDRTKPAGEAGKFVLYIWEDIATSPGVDAVAAVRAAAAHEASAAMSPTDSRVTWSRIKALYK